MKHEHDPGCNYQAVCLDCPWKSNWGDRDNASYQSWDHAHRDGSSVLERQQLDAVPGRHRVETHHQPLHRTHDGWPDDPDPDCNECHDDANDHYSEMALEAYLEEVH